MNLSYVEKSKQFTFDYVNAECKSPKMFSILIDDLPKEDFEEFCVDFYNACHDVDDNLIPSDKLDIDPSFNFIYGLIYSINEGDFRLMDLDEYIETRVIPFYERNCSVKEFYDDFFGMEKYQIPPSFDDNVSTAKDYNEVVIELYRKD